MNTNQMSIVLPEEVLEEVVYWFQLYSRAETVSDQAETFVSLSNKVFDLQTWHPEFDSHSGTMPWERDDGEYA